MKKIYLIILLAFISFVEMTSASEVQGSIDTSGLSTGIQMGFACSPASVSNGTVNAQTCVITCNSGYTLSASSCIVPQTGGSGGGGGGGGGSVSTTTTTSNTTTTNTNQSNTTSTSNTQSQGTTESVITTTVNETSLNSNVEKITEAVNSEVNKVGTISLENVETKGENVVATITGDKGNIVLKPNDNSNLSLTISPGVVATGNKDWDGQIKAPVVVKQSSDTLYIEIGSKSSPISFNKPVNIDIKTTMNENTSVEIFSSQDGKAFKSLGFGAVKNGVITITTTHFTYFAIKTVKSNISFSDIADSFANDDIKSLVSKGVIKGYSDGTFRPNNPITRAEFLAIAMKSLNVSVNTNNKISEFKDVTVEWMIPYIAKAKELGVAKGQTINGTLKFRPNDSITRGEAIAILLNAAKIKKDDLIKTTEFKDVTDSWMIPYIAKAKELGITKGQTINGSLKFRPNDSITRAESVKIITKADSVK